MRAVLDNTLIIDGYSLTLAQITRFIENDKIKVLISAKAKERISQVRQQVETLAESPEKVIYGLHTGLGRLKDYRIPHQDQEQYQQNILYSHATGTGPAFNNTIVRLTMLLRANVFCRAHSGIRLALVQRLVDFINAGIYPQIPQIGSLGVGDLQPMAHLGLCLAGMPEALAQYQGTVRPITEILAQTELPTDFQFAQREALALLSGSTVVLAASLKAWYRSAHLLNLADAALGLSMEAFRGELDAFDTRIHEARNQEGQIETARRIRQLMAGGGLACENARMHFEGGKSRVQDPVSFRASSQIHGAVRDTLNHVATILSREINASTDNPLFFENENGQMESLSGGNFHGTPLSYVMDFLSIVLTDLGVLSERRSARLLDPAMSNGLPYNLVCEGLGLNTGFALIQANAVALAGEMRILANPASTGSMPAKNNQEDHNSMAMGAVRKALHIQDYLEVILSIEVLCATQGIDLVLRQLPSARLGQGTGQLHQLIRAHIPMLLNDCYIGQLLEKTEAILLSPEMKQLVDQLMNEATETDKPVSSLTS